MSDFAGEGFREFPNLDADMKLLERVTELTDEQLEYKTGQYGEFVNRPDLMPRARKAAAFILDRLLFDMACRDGVYFGKPELTRPQEAYTIQTK